MTPTVSPVAGTLPQQPAATSSCATAVPAPYAAVATPATAVATPATAVATPATAVGTSPVDSSVAAASGGGAIQAAQGAIASPEQLIPVLQQCVDTVNELIRVLQAQGGVSGGGAAVGQCGMPGCTMNHATQGATVASTPTPAVSQANDGAGAHSHAHGHAHSGEPGRAAGNVDPSSVRDKTSTSGLTAAPLAGLDVAHRFGLPLVSGHRPGGSSSSDHTHGNAIDVSTLAIGAPESTEGTPQMKAYAEHMRQAGQRGELGVKYVILDGQIASSRDNWAWRPYTYPGKSQAELEALKQSSRGEYNRLQHYDHVHVSFN